jgi:hypothetical protein
LAIRPDHQSQSLPLFSSRCARRTYGMGVNRHLGIQYAVYIQGTLISKHHLATFRIYPMTGSSVIWDHPEVSRTEGINNATGLSTGR